MYIPKKRENEMFSRYMEKKECCVPRRREEVKVPGEAEAPGEAEVPGRGQGIGRDRGAGAGKGRKVYGGYFCAMYRAARHWEGVRWGR
ncbi:hypothetical protein SAMN02910358_01496 [Lachnospiraceae bacterium XBB1006]|nr:hypothetical protein SAMN02910358_01496 [Lachnospiraceae bacterium XBB1006]